MEVDESGRHSVKSINDVYIDLRESVFNFQEQQVFTKDTVLVDVDAVMYYKIVDVKKAVYEIDDLQVALCNTAQTQLKEVFGNLTFTQALQSQTSINEHLLEAFGKIFSRWGVGVHPHESAPLLFFRAASFLLTPCAALAGRCAT